MFTAADPCPETVSLLRALVFGADGACVALSAWSVLPLVAAFAAAVMLVRVLVCRVLFGRKGAAPRGPAPEPAASGPRTGQRRARHLRTPPGPDRPAPAEAGH